MPTFASNPSASRRRPCGPNERGIALLWATVGLFLVSGVVVAGSARMKALDDATSLEFAVEGQARQVAESGLVDALSWLRRQTTQPVASFAPKRDLTADPVVDETDDPSVGLVREYEIAPGFWGRYSVHRGAQAEPFVDANGNGYYDVGEKVYDLDKNRRRTLAWGARDVTSMRGATGSGAVWHLESEGRVFRRSRADLPLGEGPNQQICLVRLATQVRRLTVALPASAALIQSRAEEVDVKKGNVITSPTLGIAYRAGTGSPRIDGSGVKAPTVHAPTALLLPGGGWMDGGKRRLSVDEIFGIGMSTLRAMADLTSGTVRHKKSWKKQRLGYTIPDDALVVYTPNKLKQAKIVFDKKFPLRGRGVVVIDGDVEFKKGSNSQFEGILVVLGELKLHGPATFKGTVIVQKKTHIHGKKNDVRIDHDPALVTKMINELSRYRRFKTTFAPTTPMLDERPNEQFLSQRRLGGLDLDARTELTSLEIMPP